MDLSFLLCPKWKRLKHKLNLSFVREETLYSKIEMFLW